MQVFVVKKADGKHDILKDVSLLGVPTRTDSCLQMCRGTGLIWRYGNQFRVGRLAVQYMLEKLEGYQLRYHTVVALPHPSHNGKLSWDDGICACLIHNLEPCVIVVAISLYAWRTIPSRLTDL